MSDAKSLSHSGPAEPASKVAPLAPPGPPGAAPPPATTPPAAERAPASEPRELRALVDGALDRMERRARGVERPIAMPWSNLSGALGGGLWGGTLVTLVGDTGSG